MAQSRTPRLWRTAVRPRWLTLLVVALAVATVMSVLGVWQFRVYQDKTAGATARRAAVPPVPLGSLLSIDAGLPEKAVGRRVTVTGSWAAGTDQVFVSGRRHDGRDGYWVLTPLRAEDGAVAVIRGWVADPRDPAAAAPAGRATVAGVLLGSEAQDASAAAARSRVIPSLRLPSIVGMVDYRLYDGFVLLASVDPPAPGPALVDPPGPPTDHAGLRNVAYAFQWWIFGVFTLFMWCRMVLDDHRDRTGTVSA